MKDVIAPSTETVVASPSHEDAPPSNVVQFDAEAPAQTTIPEETPSAVSHGMFKVSRKSFQRQLALVAKVAKSDSMPVLTCALLSFGDGRLSVEGTNLDVFASSEVPAETTGGHRVAIPVKVLAKFVSRCSSEYLMAEVVGERLFISDLENRTNIQGLPAADMPPAHSAGSVPFLEINGARLANAITETIKFASEDETRYILNGLCISIVKGEEPVLVATDGRRLARTPLVGAATQKEAISAILPTFAAEVIRSTVPQVPVVLTLNPDETRCSFYANEPGFIYSVHARLVSGNFPNYKQVIPKAGKGVEFTVGREDMLSALGRITVLNSEKSASIKLSFTHNAMKIDVANVSLGTGHEPIAVTGGFKETEVMVALNPTFLIDLFSSWSDERIALTVHDEVSPVVGYADGKVAVLMPVRLA
jgi:DNA polymerase-3 subunit beta